MEDSQEPAHPNFCHPLEIDCDEAWTGLEELLKIACEDWAYYTCFDEEKNGYTFWLVNEDFYLACHPFTYHTLKERNEKIKEAIDLCKTDIQNELTIEIKKEAEEEYKFDIKDQDGQTIWEGQEVVNSQEAAMDAAYLALQYAQEAKFYHTNPENKQIELKSKPIAATNNSENTILAIHAGGEKCGESIQLAKKHPFIKKRSGLWF